MNRAIRFCCVSIVMGMCLNLYAGEAKKVTPKSVTASSTQDETESDGALKFDAKYAVDGNKETRWSSAFENNQWIELDLEKKVAITKVVLLWEAAYAQSYKLEVSANGKKWKTIYSKENGAGGEEVIDLDKPEKARFIRMTGIKKATDWGFSLFEFEVYTK